MINPTTRSAFLLSVFAICFALPFVATQTTVDFPRAPCPFVKGCNCYNDDVTKIECNNIGSYSVGQLSLHYPQLAHLSIRKWDGNSKTVDLATFSNLTKLSDLELTDGKITTVHASESLPSLKRLNLRKNWLENFEQLCNISASLHSLVHLDVSWNYLEVLHPCIVNLTVQELMAGENRIKYINGTFHHGLKFLDLSENKLTGIDALVLPSSLIHLNLSRNPALSSVDFPHFKDIRILDLSQTSFYHAPPLNAPSLEVFHFANSDVVTIDINKWKLEKLNTLFLGNSKKLAFIAGSLPKTVENFTLTNSQVNALSQMFFTASPKSMKVNVSGNPFDCNNCALQWALPLLAKLSGQTTCAMPSPSDNCSIGVSSEPKQVSGKFGKAAVIPCTAYGIPTPTIEWWLYRPSTFLGKFDPATQKIDRGNATNETIHTYTILGGGALQINSADRLSVERYVCVARNTHGNAYHVKTYRLDYTDWYSLDLFESVFWGAFAFCIVLCAFSFLLNITWILTRKSILWWIQRAERLSRVRKMVEAMEKYRARQMESLHDKYTRRVQLVRDNYHQQVEQLRVSYSSQAERFRDYRAAQMETMTSHLENIRDNYQQQMNKMRDFGSRRAELLWESYERQVNRMRTFSLQHRLKLMRQYKVKQRYLNKLLESVQDPHSPESMRKHEEEIRVALELPDSSVAEDHPLSRSSSFYSLPEYIIDENGQLRPSPLVPTVRFTRELRGQHGASTSTAREPSTSCSSPTTENTPKR